MSKRKWNGREQISFLQALEAELNEPGTRAAIAEEARRMEPMSRVRELHGEHWMDEEQEDWESDER